MIDVQGGLVVLLVAAGAVVAFFGYGKWRNSRRVKAVQERAEERLESEHERIKELRRERVERIKRRAEAERGLPVSARWRLYIKRYLARIGVDSGQDGHDRGD